MREILSAPRQITMKINIEYDKEAKECINRIVKLSRMKCIRCPQCGAEILMVPTLAKMVEAIENHISLHRKQTTSYASVASPNTPSIRAGLTEQVIQQASDMMNVGSKPLYCL